MTALPAQFQALAPYADSWGKLHTASERYLLRQSTGIEDLRAYYDAVAPRLEEIFAHLDSFPFEQDLPPAEALLYRITLGLTEVFQAVETYNEPTVPFVPYPHHVDFEWVKLG